MSQSLLTPEKVCQLVAAVDEALGRPPFGPPSTKLLASLRELRDCLGAYADADAIDGCASISSTPGSPPPPGAALQPLVTQPRVTQTLAVLATAYHRGCEDANEGHHKEVIELFLDCVEAALPVIRFPLAPYLTDIRRLVPYHSTAAALHARLGALDAKNLCTFLYGPDISAEAILSILGSYTVPKGKRLPLPDVVAPPDVLGTLASYSLHPDAMKVLRSAFSLPNSAPMPEACRRFMSAVRGDVSCATVLLSPYHLLTTDATQGVALEPPAHLSVLRQRLLPIALIECIGALTARPLAALCHAHHNEGITLAKALSNDPTNLALGLKDIDEVIVKKVRGAKKPKTEVFRVPSSSRISAALARLLSEPYISDDIKNETKSHFRLYSAYDSNCSGLSLHFTAPVGYLISVVCLGSKLAEEAALNAAVALPPYSEDSTPVAMIRLLSSAEAAWPANTASNKGNERLFLRYAACLSNLHSLLRSQPRSPAVAKPSDTNIPIQALVKRLTAVVLFPNSPSDDVDCAVRTLVFLIESHYSFFKAAQKTLDSSAERRSYLEACKANPLWKVLGHSLLRNVARAGSRDVRDFSCFWLASGLIMGIFSLAEVLDSRPIYAKMVSNSSSMQKGGKGQKKDKNNNKEDINIDLLPLRTLFLTLLTSLKKPSDALNLLVKTVIKRFPSAILNPTSSNALLPDSLLEVFLSLLQTPSPLAAAFIVECALKNAERRGQLLEEAGKRQLIPGLPTSCPPEELAAGLVVTSPEQLEDQLIWGQFCADLCGRQRLAIENRSCAGKELGAARLQHVRQQEAQAARARRQLEQALHLSNAAVTERRLARQRLIAQCLAKIMKEMEERRATDEAALRERRAENKRRRKEALANDRERRRQTRKEAFEAAREAAQLRWLLRDYIMNELELDEFATMRALVALQPYLAAISSDDVHEYLVTGQRKVPDDMLENSSDDDDETADKLDQKLTTYMEEKELRRRIRERYFQSDMPDFWGVEEFRDETAGHSGPAPELMKDASDEEKALRRRADAMSYHRRVASLLDAFDYRAYNDALLEEVREDVVNAEDAEVQARATKDLVPSLSLDALNAVCSVARLREHGFNSLQEALRSAERHNLLKRQNNSSFSLTKLGAAYHAGFARHNRSFAACAESRRSALRSMLQQHLTELDEGKSLAEWINADDSES